MTVYFQGPITPEVIKHIEGPRLICRNGSFRWLTRRERVLYFLGITSAAKLDKTLDPFCYQK